jgi:hypothetical protein
MHKGVLALDQTGILTLQVDHGIIQHATALLIRQAGDLDEAGVFGFLIDDLTAAEWDTSVSIFGNHP